MAGERSKTGSLAVDAKTCDRVAASEERILGAIGAMCKRLDKQNAVIAKLATEANRVQSNMIPSAPPDIDQQWTEVVKKPRKATQKPTVEVRPAGDTRSMPTAQWARPLAVIVTKKDEQFPELLRTLRSKVNPAVTGTAISKMRQTKNGNLLIEINGGADSAKIVMKEVERSIGSSDRVRMTEDLAAVEVRDLDEVTTKEEVLDAFMALDGTFGAKIINLRKVYGGAQTAIVLLPRQAARRLCADGRIRIGLVYARVRPTEPLNRCFRCLAPGHMSRTCTGVDRSAYCWRCGELGHRSSGCMATAQAANAFRDMLSAGMNDVAPIVQERPQESPASGSSPSRGAALSATRSTDAGVDKLRS